MMNLFAGFHVVLLLCSWSAIAFSLAGVENPKSRVSSSALTLDATKDTPVVSRAGFLTSIATGAASVYLVPSTAHAFRGGTGAGGLGKTKPETGVVFFNEASLPVQQRNGDVSAELLVDSGKTPVLVSYYSPWPLLETSSGMETRNLQEPESAYVMVVAGGAKSKLSKEFFTESIFASQGKYGAYGAPSDISIKTIEPEKLYKVSFTSLTPAMRESERQAFISTRKMGESVLMLITGSTTPRFIKKEDLLRRVAESFQVVASPETRMSRGKLS